MNIQTRSAIGNGILLYSTALPIKVRVVEISATLIFFFLFPLNFVRPRITQSGVHVLWPKILLASYFSFRNALNNL